MKELVVPWICILAFASAQDNLWREDVSKKMHVGVATSGYKRVGLKCSPDTMEVTIITDKDFHGVIYTRGSFYARPDHCFLKASKGREFRLSLPLDECGIQQEDDLYTAQVVLQHDDELVMPGDVAFTLKCDYAPKDVPVGATLNVSHKPVLSSISLADPDPSGKDLPRHLQSTVKNYSSVIFTPADIRPKRRAKEEL